MKLWIAVVLVLLAFNFGFIIGAIWRSIFYDMPLVEVNPPLPADDTYGRSIKALMDGKI